MPKVENPVARAEELIAEYEAPFFKAKLDWQIQVDRHQAWLAAGKPSEKEMPLGWFEPGAKPHMNWDEDWDGALVQRVRLLADHGIYINRFYRKQKIMFRMPKNWSRTAMVELIMFLYGESWRGLSFKPAAIWWGKNTSGRWS